MFVATAKRQIYSENLYNNNVTENLHTYIFLRNHMALQIIHLDNTGIYRLAAE